MLVSACVPRRRTDTRVLIRRDPPLCLHHRSARDDVARTQETLLVECAHRSRSKRPWCPRPWTSVAMMSHHGQATTPIPRRRPPPRWVSPPWRTARSRSALSSLPPPRRRTCQASSSRLARPAALRPARRASRRRRRPPWVVRAPTHRASFAQHAHVDGDLNGHPRGWRCARARARACRLRMRRTSRARARSLARLRSLARSLRRFHTLLAPRQVLRWRRQP